MIRQIEVEDNEAAARRIQEGLLQGGSGNAVNNLLRTTALAAALTRNTPLTSLDLPFNNIALMALLTLLQP